MEITEAFLITGKMFFYVAGGCAVMVLSVFVLLVCRNVWLQIKVSKVQLECQATIKLLLEEAEVSIAACEDDAEKEVLTGLRDDMKSLSDSLH